MAKLNAMSDLVRAVGETPQTITYYVKQRRLQAERAGRHYIFTQSQFDAAVEFFHELRSSKPEEERL